MAKILIVEDEADLAELIKNWLGKEHYLIETASDGLDALIRMETTKFDVVVLDIMLPSLNGLEICKRYRKGGGKAGIIMLTAKGHVDEKENGLDSGADDYMTKPFVADELLARIKARFRSQNNGQDNKLIVDDLELDGQSLEVKRKGELIQLTPQEFKLLQYLMSNKGRILTREMILNRVWLYSPDIETRVVDVYMGYLRKKIDSNYKKPLLHSVRGFGYMIKE